MDALVSTPPARIAQLPVTGRTLLFPVIGHPVAQVRAPEVFNALFTQAGVDALCFGLDLAPDQVLATCRSLLASPSVGGILVTVPYKKTLAQAAAHLGRAATNAGAVNALRRGSGQGPEGDLFDGLGFVQGLHAAGHQVAGKRVLLLGAGGAGSAIAEALAHAGVQELAVFDPVAVSIASLLTRLQPLFPRTRFTPQAAPQPKGFDFVVNASPLGLKASDPLPLDPAALDLDTVACDIIMEPAATPFLQAAMARGLAVHRGRHMLDQQVPAYLSFFGLHDLADRVRITPDSVHLETTP